MRKSFKKINRIKQKQRKSVPDFRHILNNKTLNSIPNIPNDNIPNVYNKQRIQNSLKKSIVEDDKESVCNS